MFDWLREKFTWIFGKAMSELKEQDNKVKSEYEDSELGRARRESFLKSLPRDDEEEDN